MADLGDLTIYTAAEKLRRGHLTAVALTVLCLERITERNKDIRAWAYVDVEGALDRASTLDREAREQRWHGPLHGIPVGIKDIIDVAGMPTRAGTAAYPAQTPEYDADAVDRLRKAGAVIVGKTVTTPLAYLDPPPTANPWNREHTPGGSSSGSAAAVADRMCLAALGTQTGGSVTRPATFNGIIGFKPSYAGIPLGGVVPSAWQFDTLGTFTRTVEDTYLLWHVLRWERPVDWQTTRNKMPPAFTPAAPGRVWQMREYFQDNAEPEALEALEKVLTLMKQRRVELVEAPLPGSFQNIHDAHQAILAAEAATYHWEQFESNPVAYPPRLATLIRTGLEVRATDYVAGRRQRLLFQHEMEGALADVDFAIMPSAAGAAPRDRTTTGDAKFNSPWTLAGLPTVTVPVQLSAGGMPLGVQLVGHEDQEDRLLAAAGWLESMINFEGAPDTTTVSTAANAQRAKPR